ncbi:MAG TPA: hypothetical protein VKR30_04770 [Candidatus Limnocylindrales bacterium]|nr:hypothetical protein [Candidatus Limnocylindrales bacterium]
MDDWEVWEPLTIGNDEARLTLLDLQEFAPGSFRLPMEIAAFGPEGFERMSARSVFDAEDWHGGWQRLAAFFDALADRAGPSSAECRCDSANMTLRGTRNSNERLTFMARIKPRVAGDPDFTAEVSFSLDGSQMVRVSADVRKWLADRSRAYDLRER